MELVTLLDRTWSKFDLLSEKHGVVKMETVGATYMAVGLDPWFKSAASKEGDLAFACLMEGIWRWAASAPRGASP